MSRLAAFALVLAFLAPASRADETAPPSDDPAPATQGDLETRAFTLKYIAPSEANAVVRSLCNVRKSAVVEDQRMLVLRDRPETLRIAAQIIEQVDVPPPFMRLQVVATGSDGTAVLREADMAAGAVELTFGTGQEAALDKDRLAISVHLEGTSDRGAILGVHDESTLFWSDHPHQRSENVRVTLAPGDDLVVADAGDAAMARAALGTLVGASGPVKDVRLRLAPEARPRR